MIVDEMSKVRRALFMISCMLVNFVLFAEALFMPTVNDIYNLFPNATSIVNLAVSGHYFIVIFASILGGKLCKTIGQKTVIVVGSICALTGGVLLLAIENAFFLFSMRILYGIGYAFCQVAVLALINDVYTEDDKRVSMVGYFNGVGFIVGTLFAALGGNLAAVSLRTAYSGHWIILPVIVLEILFLPYIKPGKISVGHDEQTGSPVPKEKRQGMGGLYWGMAISFSISVIANGFLLFFVSVYVAENGLGTQEVAGYALSIVTIGGSICNIAFGKIYQKLGKIVILLAYISMAVGSLVLRSIPNLPAMYGASLLWGSGQAVALTYCYSVCPAIVPKERSNDAVAILTAMFSFTLFISTYIVSWAMKYIGNGRYTPTIIIPAIICAAVFLVQLLLNSKQSKMSPS
jgi:MFS family permease